SVVPDGAGGVVVAWLAPYPQSFSDSSDVRVQRLTSAGAVAPGWPADGVVVVNKLLAAGIGPTTPMFVGDGVGGAYVGWADQRDGELDAYVVRINGSGSVAAGWLPGGTPIAANPSVLERGPIGLVPDASGGIVALWNEVGASADSVRAIHLDGSANVLWGPR